MANYDFLSTRERIFLLSHIKRELDSAIRSVKEAQSYWDSNIKHDYISNDLADEGDFFTYNARINAGTQETLNVAAEHAARAKSELDGLLSTYTGVDTNTYYANFVFKYQVTIGKAGVQAFVFASSTPGEISVVRHPTATGVGVFANGGVPTSHASLVLNEDDLVLVDGCGSHDGIYTVAIAGSGIDAISTDEATTAETIQTRGATITAVRRTI